MQTRRLGNGWIITTDPVWSSGATDDGVSSRSMANMVEVFQCWTERGWRPSADGGMFFPTDKAAGEYMDNHRAKM